LSMALARPTRVCSPEDRRPHFMFRNGFKSNRSIKTSRPCP